MRLDLRDIIHVPDARKTFRFQLDLSGQDFYGSKPIVRPVDIQGSVTNHAGALVLEGTARSVLELACDRCGKPFSLEKLVVLDSLVAQTQDLDIVTIADTDSIRLYHVVHERIGLHFVGDDQGRVLKGEAYFSDAVGTMGLQRRFFHPVQEEDGTVIGFVIASATMDSIRELRSSITQMYAKLAAVLLLAALLLSWSMTLFLQKMLLAPRSWSAPTSPSTKCSITSARASSPWIPRGISNW